MKKLLVTAVAVLASSVALAASAGNGTTEVRVRIGDLDLNTPVGAAVLYRRIERAAARVCVSLENARSLANKRLYAHCIDEAIGEAVATVHRSQLTAHAAVRLAQKRSAYVAGG